MDNYFLLDLNSNDRSGELLGGLDYLDPVEYLDNLEEGQSND